MVKRLLPLLCLTLLLLGTEAHASDRFKVGARAGLLSRTVSFDSTRLNLSGKEYSLSVGNKYGFDAAISFRVKLWGSANETTGASFHIQGDVIYAQNNMTLNVTNTADKSDKYSSKICMQTIEVPVLFCVKASVVRLSAGPVFHAFHKNTTRNEGTIALETSTALCGYTLGIGFDLGPITLDGRYNGDFRKADNIMSIGSNKGASLRSRINSWSIGVGVAF